MFMTLRSLVPVFLLCLAPGLVQAEDEVSLNYDGLAHELLAELGAADASAATFEFDELLRVGFVRTSLGLFDFYLMPEDAKEIKSAEHYKDLSLALLRAERKWLDWMEPTIGAQPVPRADIDTLSDWIRGWRTASFKNAAKSAAERKGGDLYEVFGAGAEVKAAGERLRDYMGKGKCVGLEREQPRSERVILVPSRARFGRFVAFAGWLRPELTGTFWVPGIGSWTNFYVDEYKVIATEFADMNNDGGFGAGIPMDTDTKTGLEQQVTQLATNSLLDNFFGGKIPPAFAGGLAVNLVVDIYGECNTRVDGDLSARRTEAREQFVPGGNSSGGLLPKTEADSRWRVKNQGGDRFTDMLQESQRNGGKKQKRGPDKVAYFELENDLRNKRHIVKGPFLGAAAADVELPPAEFEGDWQEFLRAYRSCFIYWLQNEAASKPEASRTNFAKLLTQLASSEAEGGVEEIVSTSYEGAKLSSKEVAASDLESRFLNWLPKAKVKPPKVKF